MNRRNVSPNCPGLDGHLNVLNISPVPVREKQIIRPGSETRRRADTHSDRRDKILLQTPWLTPANRPRTAECCSEDERSCSARLSKANARAAIAKGKSRNGIAVTALGSICSIITTTSRIVRADWIKTLC